MLIYVWSRNFPTASVSIMGLVSVEVCTLSADTRIDLASWHFVRSHCRLHSLLTLPFSTC